MTYYKSLDSLRSLAVFMVIVSHWVPYKQIKSLQLGEIGVDIFFVLSGFLITKNLIAQKQLVLLTKTQKFKNLKNFMIRRMLRIFPIYYIFLILFYSFGSRTMVNIESNFIYYALYLSNIYYFVTHQWDGILSHLWSLAVEEQFYLIWPWLVIFVPNESLLKSIILFIIIGIFSNYFFTFVFPNNNMVKILPFTAFDSFGIGGFLAWVIILKNDRNSKLKKWIFGVGIVSCFFFIMSEILNFDPILPTRTLISLTSLSLILYIIELKNHMVFYSLLNNKFLLFCGKISYTLYLFHNIIPWLFSKITLKLNDNLKVIFSSNMVLNNFIQFLAQFLLLFAISVISWYLIEKPINNFRKNYI